MNGWWSAAVQSLSFVTTSKKPKAAKAEILLFGSELKKATVFLRALWETAHFALALQRLLERVWSRLEASYMHVTLIEATTESIFLP